MSFGEFYTLQEIRAILEYQMSFLRKCNALCIGQVGWLPDMAVAAWWPVHEEWSYFDKTMRSDMTAWHLRLLQIFVIPKMCHVYTTSHTQRGRKTAVKGSHICKLQVNS
jgi:hypothetical protein